MKKRVFLSLNIVKVDRLFEVYKKMWVKPKSLF